MPKHNTPGRLAAVSWCSGQMSLSTQELHGSRTGTDPKTTEKTLIHS